MHRVGLALTVIHDSKQELVWSLVPARKNWSASDGITWVGLEKFLITMSEGLQDHRKLLAKNVESQISDEVVEEVASTDMAMHVE